MILNACWPAWNMRTAIFSFSGQTNPVVSNRNSEFFKIDGLDTMPMPATDGFDPASAGRPFGKDSDCRVGK